jgi:hypothetical protein
MTLFNADGNVILYPGLYNANLITPLVQWQEIRAQSSVVDYKKPQTARMFALWGSLNKLDIQLAIMTAAPLFDSTRDATTGNVISLFRGAIKIEEKGYGQWLCTVPYEASSNTVELTFTLGVQSTKIQQAIADVRSYSCLQTVSAATNTSINAASDAQAAAFVAAASIAALAVTASVAATAATAAAGAAGVLAAVKGYTNNAASSTTATVNDASVAQAGTINTAEAVLAVIADCTLGDAVTGAADAASAVFYLGIVTTADAQALGDDNAANVAQTDAVIAAAGGNPATLAAAAAATAASAAAHALRLAIDTAQEAALAASVAAGVAVAAVNADQVPGGNGVPNFMGAIGVNEGTVEGCDVEVGKVEFSITKKWATATLSGAYIATLADMTDRTVVNAAPFVFVWMGQTLIFSRGTLRFRGAPIKWNSQSEVEITYHFAYQRSIIPSDNFSIANSGRITKEGWLYLWCFYRATPSAGRLIMIPQSVHINQVYKYDDFSKLGI